MPRFKKRAGNSSKENGKRLDEMCEARVLTRLADFGYYSSRLDPSFISTQFP
jgi:hypothetical protein